MSERLARRLARSAWTVVVAVLVTTFVLFVASGKPPDDPFLLAVSPILTLGYATVGALIASRKANNSIGWLMITVAFGFVLASFAEEYARRGLVIDPGSVPAAQYAPLLSNMGLVFALGPVPLVILLFPTGTVPSPRWRPVAWALLGTLSMGLIGLSLAPIKVGGSIQIQNPIGIEALRPVTPILLTVGGLGSILLGLLCVVGLIVRYRRSEGEERQQLRWLAYAVSTGAVFLAAVVAFTVITNDASEQNPLIISLLAFVFFLIMAVGLPATIGIAILKYRLYDIDIVINKTVVYGALAAFITLVYVGIVVGIGTVIGQGDRPNIGLSILATAVVAVAFQPVRERVQRFANRLVYGKRATPYEVLSHFAERMASTYAADELLPQMARILGEGTGAGAAHVWLRVGGELRREGSWPDTPNGGRSVELAGDGEPALPGSDLSVPVRDRGELLGALSIAKSRGEPVTDADRKLLSDLASQAGLVLRNVKLIEELRASRQRIVSAQDEERRRIERNIHDGAQQQLVALNVKLGLARALAKKDFEKTEALIDQLQQETQDALDNLRDLARGIYPPLLADKGLVAALEAQARKASVHIVVEANGVGRYPQDTEAAVYFCVLEALQNVAKYADATEVIVRLERENGELVFEVRDDGKGFDAKNARPGSGLTNMEDRLDALGGRLGVRSEPGVGTAVTGKLPIPVGAAA
jgi:signal transduction histidine kinase